MNSANFALVKNAAISLFAGASFISEIYNGEDYTQVLARMEDLIESFDEHRLLIGAPATSIERWEDASAKLAEFHGRNAGLAGDVAIMRTLRISTSLMLPIFRRSSVERVRCQWF